MQVEKTENKQRNNLLYLKSHFTYPKIISESFLFVQGLSSHYYGRDKLFQHYMWFILW